MQRDLKIIYMGTPAFAVAPLRAILDAGYRVPAVVTSPDKPAGRGRKTQSSEVKKFADKRGMNVLQPVNLREPGFISKLKSYNADLNVVVAFRMLPEQVWKMPPRGTMNLHASLLPQYRGAAPVNHAIINGEKITGLTTFLINQDIDTGQILLQRKVEIPESYTAGDLHDVLMEEGSELVIETLERIGNGTIKPVSQSELIKSNEILIPAPKIFREHCRIDWNRDVTLIYNFIRGLSPTPSAFAFLSGLQDPVMIKFLRTGYELRDHRFSPGHIVIENRNEFRIAVPGGFIIPSLLQQAGKSRLDAKSFMNGLRNLDKLRFE